MLDSERAQAAIEEETPFIVEYHEDTNRYTIRNHDSTLARGIRFNSDAGMTESQFRTFGTEIHNRAERKLNRRKFANLEAAGSV